MKNQNLPLLIMMILVLDSFIHSAAAEDFILQSPDGNLRATISVQNQITYSLFWKQKQFLAPSSLSLSLNDERTLGHQPQVHESSYRLINEMIAPPIREKQAIIHHIGNELTLTFTSQYKLLFRAYDNGFAYRWITDFEKPMVVKSELVEFRIADDDALLYLPLLPDRPDVDKFHCSYEENYSVLSMRELKPEYIAYLPLMVKLSQGLSLVITEADLQDYPGLYLSGHTQTAGFSGVFPGYPLEEKMNGSEFKQKVVTRRADYLAETNGCRTFPWRVLLLAEDDAKLIENSMVYCLGTPCVLTDTDWIRPGKCTDDWTIDTNLYNVPFRAGLNTETYKFFIDFAANFKIPYVMLDAGWSNNDNLAEINPQVNFEEVRAYAGKKGVGLFLWTLAMTLDSQLEDACRRFQEWGIKGIMVDFMDRDDQKMVQFYQRVAKVTAEHHLMVLFHGAFKPTGLRRTYPNIVTREAVLGHEYNKWSDKVTPDHI
ncbi:MAG: glycoside hydrolase family 97 protein, partial [Calditrichaeota bacterium]